MSDLQQIQETLIQNLIDGGMDYDDASIFVLSGSIIAKYKKGNGGYDIKGILQDEGEKCSSLTAFFNPEWKPESLLAQYAIAANERKYDKQKSEAKKGLETALEKYLAGERNNQIFNTLATNGYGYIEGATEFAGAYFVFTGKVEGDVYADWKEENMLGVNG